MTGFWNLFNDYRMIDSIESRSPLPDLYREILRASLYL